MSQQRATDQNMATSSSSNSNNNNNQSDVITLDDDDEDGEVIFVGHVRPTGSTIDLCLTPSTSAAAAAAARSGSSSGTADDDPGSRATASASNPLSPASSPADAAKSVTVDAGTTISVGDPLAAAAAALECPICLQTCIHPARLPCGHIFCFLCVKGVAYKNPRCAMCRREIPVEFLDHPQLVNGIEDICTTRATEDGYQWYYEGRNGWWQYDDRTSQDIEEAFKKGDKSCTILVAGYVYIVDLEQLVQQRQNEPTRCRRVKRDLATIPKKGVAGLRIEGNQVTSDTVFSRPTSTTNPTTVSAAASSFMSTIAATDAAIRIASDIIGSTLAHADELTRGLAASNISDDPSSSSSSGEQTNSTNPQDAGRSPASSPASSSMQDLITRDLRNTQQVIAHNQHTIDLFEQALNDFQALTMRNYVDSSDEEEQDDQDQEQELREREHEQLEAGEQPQSGDNHQGF
ncbi:E3 ubiquitin-protein ligase rnf146 isoform X1 [Drosophila gunungcola]|uniref:E3 ubiquitin-protein ligase rnf146 isoform X1 n=1 Tax=Drosophila gunungcola TaxID=103775 RepID=UPI0022E7C128|nr:E3 ubiquitin-protein ligase rnf146 isoform X1 [Drosophila gunungcola]